LLLQQQVTVGVIASDVTQSVEEGNSVEVCFDISGDQGIDTVAVSYTTAVFSITGNAASKLC